MTIHEILKQYWGYDEFRPLQEEIINAVLQRKDSLALLPTGGGKSICFQVPSMMQDGLCLVVSPLIALIKDQVQNLKSKGIPTLSIYSGMSFLEVKKTLQNAAHGNYKFLYVSPERLETSLFLEYLPILTINLIAVDEAHCISQWGYDFRPSYLRIAQLREQLPNVPILALTASATLKVQDDVCEKLAFSKNQQRFQQSYERANLSYSIFNVPSKQIKLQEILKNVKGSAIVYCKSRKRSKEVAEMLSLNNISAGYYHAGLSTEERNKRQENWISNATRVIACTNAFGMGIDKANVRTVVHYDVPDCLENYYQEAGRAGRDGKRAYAVLLFGSKEPDDLLLQPGIRFPEKDEIKKVYTAIMNYRQIAAGSGEGLSFDFDLATFTSAFKINILTATYAIKALEQENILSYNEVFFKPSTLEFSCDKNQLQAFEQQYPKFEPLIKGLLRSYEGVFDFPVTIYETELAKFIQKSLPQVQKELEELNQLGLINYSSKKDSPQITLLQNRMYADSFVLNLSDYLKRKENFELRVKAIIHYIQEPILCRSKMIAAYFNDRSLKACGICDNCIKQANLVISAEEFNKISDTIFDLIGEQPLRPTELIKKLSDVNKSKCWKVIDYLLAEKKVSVTKEGEIKGL